MRSSSITVLALGGLLATAPVLAQSPSQPSAPRSTDQVAGADTVLRLSEAGMVERPPSELRVTLRAEARGSGSGAVQAEVNRRVTAALEAARRVAGVQASTGGYWTGRSEKERVWTASQTLLLRGEEATPLLELAGTLQQQGLVMNGMDWSLSSAQRLEARQEAGKLAIEALQARAEAVAQQLGLRVAEFRELRLDTPDGAPRFRVAAAPMAARGEAAPPPVSAPEPEMVTATAEALFILRR
ncbi:SIMPL domain-containing protein [Pseudoroseomonas globiformis]|uniref:SIMPL domain-containing protein n=1 Tax=Teichococcus globiformis TaxID=2307229 RepID=A0ABV7FU43_9PROT